MIIDILFYVIGLVLALFNTIFHAIDFVVPNEIANAITYGFAQLKYMDFIVPIATFMNVLAIYLQFVTGLLFVKTGMWLYHLIRHGGDVDLPYLGRRSNNAVISEKLRR